MRSAAAFAAAAIFCHASAGRERKVSFMAAMMLLGLISAAQAESGAGFIENLGQFVAPVQYCAMARDAAIYLTPEAIVIDLRERPVAAEDGGPDPFAPGASALPGDLPSQSDAPPRRGCAVWLRFADANPNVSLEARGELPVYYNYFLGSDPSRWRSDVHLYEEIIYHDLWEGADLCIRIGDDRVLYSLATTPGADPALPRFTYDGAEQVVPTPEGDFRVETPVGWILDRRPAAERAAGELQVAHCPWKSMARDRGSMESPLLGEGVAWSTFLGGGVVDVGLGVDWILGGPPIVVGYTNSWDFPATPGVYDLSYNFGTDVFVSELSVYGGLFWSTFLGGGVDDAAYDVALDADHCPVLTGTTQSTDFPTTVGAFDRTHNGSDDVFIAKLNTTGTALLWSMFLGGANSERAAALALDESGNVFVTGPTMSVGFPTTVGAYDRTYNFGYDAFVTCVSSSGATLLWSTFLGGGAEDLGCGIALDADGRATVAGLTTSPEFPTTPGAFDLTHNGDYDAFVTKLNESGSGLVWSTFAGGNDKDTCADLVIDPFGCPVISGYTESADFPTTPGAYDLALGGDHDAFVTRLTSTGSGLLWSTYLGGSADEYARGLASDAYGRIILTGATYSSDFPSTSDAFDPTYNQNGDAFVARLARTGTELEYGTFLGGVGNDSGHDAMIDPVGCLLLTGFTASTNFPVTPGVYDETYNGGGDAFVVRMDLPVTFWHIRPDGHGMAPTIQAGIDSAAVGDVVWIDCGTYHEHNIVMKSGIAVRSEENDPACVTIDAQGLGRIISCAFIDQTTTVSGLTLTGGLSTTGGGIYANHSALRVSNCIVKNNAATQAGGGINLMGLSTATIEDCVIDGNSVSGAGTTYGGGVACTGTSTPVLKGCIIAHNAADLGGGMYSGTSSVPSLANCTIAHNVDDGYGAGVYCVGATADLTHSIIAYNADGSAVYCGSGGSATLACCDVYANEGNDWVGCIASQEGVNGNFSASPLFCDELNPEDPYTLEAGSPCLPENNPVCGGVGARPLGCSPGAVGEGSRPLAGIALYPPAPNPLRGMTGLAYGLTQAADVQLEILDIAGRRIRLLVDGGRVDPGRHELTWDGTDDAGRAVPAGIYFCRLDTGATQKSRRLVVLR
jgi:hypothetical protein